jgi:hypothetical protein
MIMNRLTFAHITGKVQEYVMLIFPFIYPMLAQQVKKIIYALLSLTNAVAYVPQATSRPIQK